MDFSALLTYTLESLIGAGIAILVPALVKFILGKISKDNLSKYRFLADSVVFAVEQTMGTADAQAKKAAAVAKLSAATKGVLKPEDIDHLIESSVYQMKQQYAKALADVPETSVPASAPVQAEAPAVQK